MLRPFVPVLDPSLYKGQAGKIGVVGGSLEYTGAPYYAAMAALKTGADLASVFCAEEAVTPIKCYSPELIVYPNVISSLDKGQLSMEQCRDIFMARRLSALVVGTGLSRHLVLQNGAAKMAQIARELELPLIMDGDGINTVLTWPQIVQDYQRAIITPNVNEFKRLCEQFSVPSGNPSDLSKALGGVVIVQKGFNDIIAQLDQVVYCTEQGSLRRCGGQGDVLAGCMGTFAAWAMLSSKDECEPLMAAALGACRTVRHAAFRAFSLHQRSTTTPDILQQLGASFDALYSTN